MASKTSPLFIAVIFIGLFSTWRPVQARAEDPADALPRVIMMEDSRFTTDRIIPYTTEAWPAEVRRHALIALGAVGDPAGCDILLLYADDADETLAAAALAALGQLWFPNRLGKEANPPDPRALDILEKFLSRDFTPASPKGESLRAIAAEAFGKIAEKERAAPLIPFLQSALHAPPANFAIEQAKAALVGLFRANPPGAVEAATEALEHSDSGVRAYAAIALGRLRQAQAIPALMKALSDANFHVRAEAARALGRFGGVKNPAPLTPLLYSMEQEEVIGGLLGFGKGQAGAPLDRAEEMLQGVRDRGDLTPTHLALLDALGRRGDEGAVNLLMRQASRGGALRVRAIKALGDAQAAPALLSLDPELFSGDHLSAAAYVDALAACDLEETRNRLRDYLTSPLPPSPYRNDQRSRRALLEAAMNAKATVVQERLKDDLESADPLLREVACEYVSRNPDVLILHSLQQSLQLSVKKHDAQAAIAALNALEKIAAQFDSKNPITDMIIQKGEELVTASDINVRMRAASLLVSLGGKRHPEAFFNLKTGRDANYYRRIAAGLADSARYKVATSRGEFILEIRNADAPLIASRFAELVARGFYNGQIVHRVEPNFVFQTGDPEGTGAGGSGMTMRDETGRMPFDAGTLGLATSGRDTGDSQWFITHVDMPHLDGAYTAFGRVVTGKEVVDRLVIGDKIESVTPLTAPENIGKEQR